MRLNMRILASPDLDSWTTLIKVIEASHVVASESLAVTNKWLMTDNTFHSSATPKLQEVTIEKDTIHIITTRTTTCMIEESGL
jgi:hypothetical protein